MGMDMAGDHGPGSDEHAAVLSRRCRLAASGRRTSCTALLDADIRSQRARCTRLGLPANFEPGTRPTEPIARERRRRCTGGRFFAHRNRWPDSEDYSRRSMSPPGSVSGTDREADAFIAELVHGRCACVTAGGVLGRRSVRARAGFPGHHDRARPRRTRRALTNSTCTRPPKPWPSTPTRSTLAAALEALGAPRTQARRSPRRRTRRSDSPLDDTGPETGFDRPAVHLRHAGRGRRSAPASR